MDALAEDLIGDAGRLLAFEGEAWLPRKRVIFSFSSTGCCFTSGVSSLSASGEDTFSPPEEKSNAGFSRNCATWFLIGVCGSWFAILEVWYGASGSENVSLQCDVGFHTYSLYF